MSTPVNDRYEDNQSISLVAYDQYAREVAWAKVEALTEEEEAVLFQRIERSKRFPRNQHYAFLAICARDRLVEDYQPLVVFIARKYLFLAESMELLDLVQEGNIGLLEAIEHDDRSKGKPFRSLAARCIGHAIWRALRRSDRLVHVSGQTVDELYHIRRARRDLRRRLGRMATPAEVAAALQMSVAKVEAVQKAGTSSCLSIQAMVEKVGENADDYIEWTPLYGAGGASALNHESLVALRHVYETMLTPRQKEVLRLRYGLDGSVGESTYRAVGEALGVHHTSVRQHEEYAKKKIARILAPMLGLEQKESVA